MTKFNSISCFTVLVILLIQLFLGCDREVSRSPVEPQPSEGTIVVTSNPLSASIYLNGRNTGRFTPDSITFLDDGTYQLTLKKKYFRDTTFSVSIKESERVFSTINYYDNPLMFGKVALFSTPMNAQIFIGDSSLNRRTPDTLRNLIPGEYNFIIRLPNHRDDTVRTIVESNKINSYSSLLRDTSAWVDYQIYNSKIPTNILSHIAVDQNGIKWIGTLEFGLIRFDEVTFNNYTTQNSGIPSNRIDYIAVSPSNEIWVATNSGVGIFNGFSWRSYNGSNSGLTTNSILSISFQDNGTAWIGATNGLYKFDGGAWTKYNDTQLSLWVNESAVTPQGRVMMATSTAGIIFLENELISYLPKSIYNYPTNSLSSVDIDNFGNFWFCHLSDTSGRGGISMYNGSSFTNYFLGTPGNRINRIFVDQNNNKWVSTFEGLVKYNSSNITQSFTTLNSKISSDRVAAVAVDNQGIVWVTTQGGGLNKLKIY